jgi:hypothetical protein
VTEFVIDYARALAKDCVAGANRNHLQVTQKESEMKSQRILTIIFTPLVLLLIAAVGLTYAQGLEPHIPYAPQAAAGTAFTYQGQLRLDGEPVDATCEMAFRLYDAESEGDRIGMPITCSVVISDGLFTQPLEFGGDAFSGDRRWLDIRVMCPDDSGFTVLGRQELTAAPYANYALSTGALNGQPVTNTAPTVGQVLEWNGASWGSAPDDDTVYTAGNQLELTNTTLNVLEGVGSDLDADLLDGLDGADYLEWSNLTNVPSGFSDDVDDVDDADTDPGNELNITLVLSDTTLELSDAGGTLSADLSSFQQRVSGICAIGSTVRVINPDGTVECQTDAPLNRSTPPATNTLTTLDSIGESAQYTSVTIGADGLPLISYYVDIDDSLIVAHCNDVACISATTTTIDSNGVVGWCPSVNIGADGLGVMSYYDVTGRDLRVAHCNNLTCTSSTIHTVDSVGNVGTHTSLAIGADGLALISYTDWSATALKVAHCDDLACTSATTTTLDNDGNLGWYTSLAIGADGLGLISYYDVTNGALKVAHCNDVACTSAVTSTLDSDGNVGRYTSLTIGADGLPLIAYYDVGNGALKVAHCGDSFCASATIATLENTDDVGQFASITIGADGLGLISYYDETNGALKVAHCSNVACTSATTTVLDSRGDVGRCTSITIGVDGLPLVSYTSDELRVAHCTNPFCVPYFRRR